MPLDKGKRFSVAEVNTIITNSADRFMTDSEKGKATPPIIVKKVLQRKVVNKTEVTETEKPKKEKKPMKEKTERKGKRKFSPAQLAAQEKFKQMVKKQQAERNKK